MQDGGDTQDSGLGHLEALVANKEREWKELHARRIHLLEDSLKKAKEDCSSLRYQNQKLKEDFQYNLSILDEREKELERYDVITLRAVNSEQNRQEELSRLRLQVAALEEKQAKDAEARQEELRLSQKRAAQQKLQLDELRHSMTGTILKQTEELERVKLEAQHRLREMEGELNRQKQEVTATCAKQLGQREHGFNLKLDEMHAAQLSKDLKIKLLSKECEAQSQARMQATRALKASEAKLQHEVDLKNEATAVKEVRIKELEDKLKRTENKLKKQKDDLIKKNEDVTRALKEKDEQLEARCQAHKEQLKRKEKHIIKLKNDLEIQATKACLAQKDMAVVLEEKDDIIKRLRTEVTTAQTDWERYMSQTSNEMVGKNTELITLQNRISKLQAELERSREEVNRYKQDVNAGLKREAALEQARVQLELEWQERYDAVKAKHYLANEQLIQDLTLARDQAKAELREKEKEFHDLTLLLLSVEKGSDKAAQGLTPKPDAQASEEMNSLVEQNSFLRAVVSQMRKDMEDLGHLLPHQQNKLQAFPAKGVQASEATAAPPTTEPLAKHPDTSANTIPAYMSDDAQALKQEVVLLNARCRHLEEQLEGASGLPNPGPAAATLKETLAHTSLGKPHPHDQKSQEVLCLDQRAESTALRSQAARGPHAEQGAAGHAVVQQFQDENIYRWQQQLTSAVMAGAASGNVQGVKRNIALAHARLKQAASYIARLSKEKQQLIQMGNCLRARITSTGLEEAIEQKRDSATIEQHERLSALEQLQYRLTTQELQYAVRQMAHTVAEHAASSDSRGLPMEGDGNLCYTRREPAEESGTSNMSDKTPLVSQQQNSLEVKTQPSSGESLQSLKEIWEILDHGLSSSVYSEGESELSRSRAAKSVTAMVTGTSAPIHSGSPALLQQKKNPSKILSNLPKNCRHGAPGKIGKIRNYNTKD